MDAIGRNKEKEIMQTLLFSRESEFLAVYGRRRVGKTYLIRQTLKNQIVFEATGLKDSNKADQLANFWMALHQYFEEELSKPKSWLEAFHNLSEALNIKPKPQKQKHVIFIDEVSWFDTARAEFLPALGHFWNSYCTKRNDILLVICGSAASWIINKVINNRGGLHNRITKVIRLMPFDLAETKQMLDRNKVKLSNYDIAQLYMCIGGIPYYLKQVQAGKSVGQILDDLFFGARPSLSNEYENLYAALFKNHQLHEKVVQCLANKNKGLSRNDLLKSIKIKTGGGITKVLDELEQCGFITISADYLKPKEGRLYRLMDEYSIFYHQFLIHKTKKYFGQTFYTSQKFRSWVGFAFENMCIKHQIHIAKSLGISGIDYVSYSFDYLGDQDYRGAQIDMLLDRSDNVLNIFEMKFHNETFKMTTKLKENLINKRNALARLSNHRKSIFVTLVTASGSDKNANYLATVTNEITLNQLF